jgi:GntR family transcriptional regulator/GntR family mannosyl-D-glycerate transport/metabolism transcriptional repressor
MEKTTKIELIEEYIIKNIEDNFYYTRGNKIESENQLAQMFSVSRMTARKAIDNLVGKLYLYRIKSYGTYVQQQDKKSNIYLNEIIGFKERSIRDNLNHATKVIAAQHETTPNNIKKLLNLANNETVFHIEKLRYIDNIPAIYENSYMPSRFVINGAEEEIHNSKYIYAKNHNFIIKDIHKEYQAMLPSYRIRKILEINPQHVLFLQSLLSYLENGDVFEFTKIYYNQDKFRFLEKITH